jgi:hypothetical protein
MKNKQTQNNGRNQCAKTVDTNKSEDSLLEVLWNNNSMTKHEINIKLDELHTRHLNSMDKDEIWEITREILYLKIALGLMKKHRKTNLNKLDGHGLQYDCAFMFKIGNVYPNGVAVMAENYTSTAHLIQDFVAELSPYLNEAEQMLFKVAVCEEVFNPDNVE